MYSHLSLQKVKSIVHDQLLTELPAIGLYCPRFHCPFHKIPPLETTLSHFSPVHTLILYFFLRFPLILSSDLHLGVPRDDLFRPKFCTHLSFHPLLFNAPSISSSSHPKTNVQIMKFHIVTVITVPPSRPNSDETSLYGVITQTTTT
jgi:hypothetical protein